MAYKTIRYLSFAETAFSNQYGDEFPVYDFSIYHMPRHFEAIGQRFALYLYTKNIRLADDERITLVFSSYLNEDHVDINDRHGLDGAQYVTIGVNPKRFNALDEREKQSFILALILKALLTINPRPEQKKIITAAYQVVAEAEEDLEIVYMTKKVQQLQVQLILKLKNSGHCDVILSAFNHTNEAVRKMHLFTEQCITTALHRCGNILIRKDKIIIKPVRTISNDNLQPVEIPCVFNHESHLS